MSALVADNRQEALINALRLIPPQGSIAFAGSQTIREIGLRDRLLEMKDIYDIIDPYEPGINAAESAKRRRQTLLADVMLTGSNAITMNGHLVNMDNQGNRVAGLAFGPRKVIVVVGHNKIVKTDGDARKRIANIAAPLNSLRLKKGNPCEKEGKCLNCHSDSRICRIFSIISGQAIPDRIHIIIVKENLGF